MKNLLKIAALVLCIAAIPNLTKAVNWSGTVTLTNGQVVSDNVTLTGNVTIHIAGGIATISGVISSSNSSYTVTKTGEGGVRFTGENTYAGTTTISAGVLFVGNNTSTGRVTGNIVNNASLSFHRSNDHLHSNNISGTGALFKMGDGKLTLSGSNTYSGSTYISAGILQVGNGTSGSIANTLSISIYPNSTLLFMPSGNMTFSKVISGEGHLKYSGVSTQKLTLTGANTYSGSTTVTNGTLQIGDGTSTTASINSTSGISLESSTSILRFASGTNGMTCSKVISGSGKVEVSGTLYLTGNNTYTGTTTIGVAATLYIGNGGTTGKVAGNIVGEYGSSTLRFSRSDEVTYAGVISGLLDFYKMGSSKLILTGANTYSGPTYISNGTLQVGNGTSTTASIGSTASVHFTGSSATLRFMPGADMTFSKSLQSTSGGILEYAGSSTKKLYLTGNNSYTGTTTIESGGHLYIGNGGTSGKMESNIVNNGTLYFDRSDNSSYHKIISGTGSVTKMGSGTLDFTNTHTYSGATMISAGTLVLTSAAGNHGELSNTSGVSISSGALLSMNPPHASSMIFDKVISGQGNVEVVGNGEMYFTANNTYTGTTTIVNSYLKLYIGNGGVTGAVAGNIINNSGKLYFKRSNDYGYTGVISGTGDVYKQGAGIVSLTGANTYSGATIVEAGTLSVGNNTSTTATIGSTSGVTLSSGATIRFMPGNDVTFSKVISGTGGKLECFCSSTKTLTLTANNTYTGTTNINGGRLTIGNGSTTGSVAGNIITNTCELYFNRSNNFTYSGVISGTGSVTKTGTGTLTLSGNNTCTGLFILSDGTLKLSGNWGGAFTKNSNGELDVVGNPTIGGALTFKGGTVTMDLTQTTPSKITALGAFSATAPTTLTIASAPVTNQVIMQAASGIGNTSDFVLNMPGMTASLQATGQTLLLTANTTDVTPPTPGVGINGTATSNTASLNWTAATDNQTPTESLRYFVYQSLNDNITSVANCETNGTLLNSGGTTNIIAFEATGLNPTTNYWFNVVVSDLAGNKAAYTPKALTTTQATLAGTVSITGNAVFGETLSANTAALTSDPVIANLGTLSYQWKRGTTDIGTNSSSYTLVEADIAKNITVTVTAANCTGSVTSPETAPVQKAEQSAPATAPTMASNTATSITLNAVAGCEYNINSGAYQSSPVFAGLSPNTPYAFTQRKAETAIYLPSPASAPAAFSTLPAGGNIYTIIATVNNSEWGTITPSGEAQVEEGNNITFTITPNSGYKINDVKVNGSSVGAVSTYTFENVHADGAIDVVFEAGEVGVEEWSVESGELRVYPNPTRGELRVESGELRVESVEIYDVMGRTVGTYGIRPEIGQSEIRINVEALPTGIYILRIGTQTAKFVKQ